MGIAADSANSMAVSCIYCSLVCTYEHANDEGLVQVLYRKCISFLADMNKSGLDITQGVCTRRGSNQGSPHRVYVQKSLVT